MKNNRELLGIIANVLIVVLVLLIIVVGLNKIGIYRLPVWAEKLIGTYEGEETSVPNKDSASYENLSFNQNSDIGFSNNEFSYENARQIIENITPIKNYSQSFEVKYISKIATRKEAIDVLCSNGLYYANILDEDGDLIKQLYEDEETSSVINYVDSNQVTQVFPADNFDIYEQCGFILTAENFLSSGFVLDETSFSYSMDEVFGTIVTLDFVNSLDGYTQREKYTVSLDYGVVVSAECYEQENLVYSMTTSSFSA